MNNKKSGPKPALYVLAAILISGILFAAYWYKTKNTKVSADTTEAKKPWYKDLFKEDQKYDLVLHYNTFPGAAGIVLANGGKETQPGSIIDQMGMKVLIVKNDDFNAAQAALLSGEADAMWCTFDALSTSMGSKGSFAKQGVKAFAKINESRGADAMVATAKVRTPQDIKGKKVALMLGSVSHSLFLEYLENNNLSIADVNVIPMANGVDAADAFKANQVDVALVWAPDDLECVKKIAGSKVIFSTADATNIAADGIMATSATLDQKHDMLVKLVDAWMQGNALINAGGKEAVEAKKLFSTEFGFPEELIDFNKIRFNTIGDNVNFFGLNTGYRGVTGDKMYTRMVPKYIASSDILKLMVIEDNPLPWYKSSSAAIIESLADKVSLAGQQAEGEFKFAQAPTQVANASAISSKQVTINFATGSAQLTDDAKDIVRAEVLPIAEGFGNSYIRLEGNTDNTGSYQVNVTLSKQRAEAVKAFLVREYGFDPNKFIVVGNGPDKPVVGYESNANEAARAANRRTDIEVVSRGN